MIARLSAPKSVFSTLPALTPAPDGALPCYVGVSSIAVAISRAVLTP